MNKLLCDVCNSELKTAIKVHYKNKYYHFDTIQCLITKLSPRCITCNCIIFGKQILSDNFIFCSNECFEKHDGILYERSDSSPIVD